jgi:hypothetical protein
LIGYLDALSLGNQTDIPVIFKNMPVLPKILPSKALDSVTRDCLSNFSRNRQPKATALEIVPADINDKKPVLDPLPTFEQSLEIGSLEQSVVLGERFSF